MEKSVVLTDHAWENRSDRPVRIATDEPAASTGPRECSDRVLG
jgi:hypothetical protein